MLYKNKISPQTGVLAAMSQAYRQDEASILEPLLSYAALSDEALLRIRDLARDLVIAVRQKRVGKGGLDAFMYQYNLSSEEGIALMCLAEALLRIPDKETQDKLIKDKLASADWEGHAGKSSSFFVNAATWGLMLTGKIYDWDELSSKKLSDTLKRLTVRSGEPVIRQAANYAMKILGKQFVMGRNIEEALKRAEELEAKGYRYSYDMLGEAARTAADAERYYQAYQKAIIAIGAKAKGKGVINAAGISVKLSALYPRYEFSKYDAVLKHVVPKLTELALMAKKEGIGLTVDAEEADRLELSLDILLKVFADPDLQDWHGLGLALQAYQKRAFYVIDLLAEAAKKHNKPWMLRLVKGAYWDSEIKNTQERGLANYPVFTRKVSTDVSYLACAKKMIGYDKLFFPQFATHNAYTAAAILEMMGDRRDFEFQCLHGMGQPLYDEIVGKDKLDIPCRIYAPVGSHEDLLAYLVRRLLENGANTSFVNRIVDASEPIENLLIDPILKVKSFVNKPHPKIALPRFIYGNSHLNSIGVDLTHHHELSALQSQLDAFADKKWQAGPIIAGQIIENDRTEIKCPTNQEVVGSVSLATKAQVEKALEVADIAFASWEKTPATERADILDKAADLLEENFAKFMAIAIREAGKNIPDAVAEVREAIDFCRYYAAQTRLHLAQPLILPGPTGEHNQLTLHGRGVVVCISPWNFPLAIFMGQVVAGLAAGNAVIAKPAAQTPIIAFEVVKLLHEAGIPNTVLQLLPGKGSVIGPVLINDPRVKAIIFTGSTETAREINQTLAHREGPIATLIAETGGQNAMIVDSSALPEQVVQDVITSAFGSAGQRCSALRVLFIQEDVAPKILTMLKGAMQEIVLGDPSLLATDIGPVIDKGAKQMLEDHFIKMNEIGQLIYQVPSCDMPGSFFSPCAFEIDSLDRLEREVFGPFLHVIRFKANELDKVIAAINKTGYGLTLGIHSRIESTVRHIIDNVKVGNTYVNRSMIGAVVGVQPFGGEGLSGTGPKAGGPHYLLRLCTERTVTVNTTAAGGNASLMSMQEEG